MNDQYVSQHRETWKIPNKQFSKLITAVLETGKSFRFKANGFSMTPLIKDGDNLTLSHAEANLIHIGDVVAFINPPDNQLIVHRVVARKKKDFLLKSDNGKSPDGWISAKRIIGRVNKIERENGQVRFGLGPEKGIVALLSRVNCLRGSIRFLWILFPLNIKRLFR